MLTLPDGRQISYDRDALGRITAKRINGAVVKGWIYKDGLKPIAETDLSGNVVSFFVYGSSPLTPDYMTRAGNTYRLIRDHVGSVRLVVDINTGAIAQRLDYDSFGNVLADTNPGFQPFGFQSGLYDTDTGFVQFGLRWYDPLTGRWLSKDPILLSGGLNVYAFCANNPVNFIDPDGLYWGRQPWQTPGVVGRPNTPVSPGGIVSEFIEKYMPAGYTFGEMHDTFVGAATSAGFPDWLVNIPSMLPMYRIAQLVEVLRSLEFLNQPRLAEKPPSYK